MKHPLAPAARPRRRTRLGQLVCLALASLGAATFSNAHSALLVPPVAAARGADAATARPWRDGAVVAVQSARRGAPWLQLDDGVEIPSEASKRSVASSGTTLATADFDEDGVADLAAGYSAEGGGLVTVARGNVDAIYPNAPEAQARRAAGEYTDAPFLSPTRDLTLATEPQLMLAGDFDGDGHADILVARRGDSAVQLLRGDGLGGFAASKRIELDGNVTAIGAGEIDAADGILDLVVGVYRKSSSNLLVYRSKTGALSVAPEVIALPGAASSIDFGQLDDRFEMDCAVAAGGKLVVIHGQSNVAVPGLPAAKARLEVVPTSFAVASVAVGNFAGDSRRDLAILGADGAIRLLEHGSSEMRPWGHAFATASKVSDGPFVVRAKMSSMPHDDLVVVQPARSRVSVMLGDGDLDGSNVSAPRIGPDAVAVDLEVEGSPVAAVPMRLNADPYSDLMLLRAGSLAPVAIPTLVTSNFTVNSTADTDDAMPGDDVCDDGLGNCTLRAAISESNASSGADSIDFSIGSGGQTISPATPLPSIGDVTIDATTQPGFTGSPIITLDGSIPDANGLSNFAGDALIRGFVIKNFTGAGVFANSSGGTTTVEGCYLGTNASGTAAAANSLGVDASSAVVVGGTTAAARNVISGNGAQGIRLSGSGTDSSSILGNYIGTNAAGTAKISNGFNGVEIDGGSSIQVGNSTGPNLISGNDANTTLSNGVYIHNFAFTNQVLGNIIGLDVTASTAIGNGANGILDGGFADQLGASQAGQGNIISGNGESGIRAQGVVSGPAIQSNVIGLNAAGTTARPNGQYGVLMDGASAISVGGMLPPESNVISGNTAGGIFASNGSDSLIVASNLIGSAFDGVTSIPNGGDGVRFDASSSFGLIVANRIFSNSGNGITSVGASTHIAIQANSITGNTGIGIDYLDDGPTANDPGESDGIGNFPVITAASFDGSSTISASGTLDSTANSHFVVEVFLSDTCDSSGFGQGDTPIGNTDVFTDGTGHGTFSLMVPGVATPGQVVTATSTLFNTPGRPQGSAPDNTSEFSACFPVSVPSTDLNVTMSGAPSPVAAGSNITYTITVADAGNIANTVVLSDSTPTNTTFVSLNAPAGWSCTTPSVGGTGSITCNAAMLATSDGPQVFTLVVKVGNGVAGGTVISNTASVSSATFDTNMADNTDMASVTVQSQADVSIGIADAPDPVAQTSNISYTVTVQNLGPDVATGVAWSFSTPSNTTFVSASTAAGWSCTTPSVGGTGTVNCSATTLPVGSTAFTVVVNVDGATPDGTVIMAATSVSSTSTDSTPGNDSASTTTTVSSAAPTQADLGLTKTADPTSPVVASDVTYTIGVTNFGPATASGVLVNDSVPEGTTFVSASAPAGWSITSPSVGGTGTVSYQSQTLSSGSGTTLTLVVHISPSVQVGSTIPNTATVFSENPDSNEGNNSASANVTVAAAQTFDMSVTLSGTPNPVAPGGTLTYTVVATNEGPGNATSVAIRNDIPANTTFVSATASTGGTTQTPAAGGTGTVTCTWPGETAAGATHTATIVVQVGSNVEDGATISDVASTTAVGLDSDLTNNSASVDTTVHTQASDMSADLVITTSEAPSQIDTGEYLTYVVTVHNNGPGTASDVSVSGSTPEGTRLVSIDSTQGNASGISPGGQGAFNVAIGDIDADSTVTITIVVNVTAPGGASFANSVVVSSGTNDPNGANNTSTTGSTTVRAGNDTMLTWDPPLACDDDCLNPPLHLQTSTLASSRFASIDGHILHQTRNTVIGYNIYRSNNPNVQATGANFFTSVPPTTTSYVAPTAPGGSFFTITAMYPNGESSETNAASGGIPEPQITGFKINGNKVTVDGSGFTDTVHVFIDGIPFQKNAKVKKENTRVNQKGKLLIGQSVQQYFAQQGHVVLVSVLNSDTGIGTFLYRQ